jgi:predicted nuclease with TOPRIM domain
MDNATQLRAAVAALESKVDMLESELSYLNEILMRCGFPEGVKTLKTTVEELLKEGLDSIQEKPSFPENQ